MAYRYQLTPQEMFYFLFRKKICPRCGAMMDKQKDFVTVKGIDLKEESHLFFRPDVDVKDYKYFYICHRCGRRYSLTELANQK